MAARAGEALQRAKQGTLGVLVSGRDLNCAEYFTCQQKLPAGPLVLFIQQDGGCICRRRGWVQTLTAHIYPPLRSERKVTHP